MKQCFLINKEVCKSDRNREKHVRKSFYFKTSIARCKTHSNISLNNFIVLRLKN